MLGFDFNLVQLAFKCFVKLKNVINRIVASRRIWLVTARPTCLALLQITHLALQGNFHRHTTRSAFIPLKQSDPHVRFPDCYSRNKQNQSGTAKESTPVSDSQLTCTYLTNGCIHSGLIQTRCTTALACATGAT